MYNSTDRVITISISDGGKPTNQKIYFDKNLPYQLIIKAITVSYYWTIGGQTDQGYLTLVDRKNQTLIYNYPLIDLMDYSNVNAPPWNPVDQFKIRQFNLYDVNLINSYFFLVDPTITTQSFTLNLNFYY